MSDLQAKGKHAILDLLRKSQQLESQNTPTSQAEKRLNNRLILV